MRSISKKRKLVEEEKHEHVIKRGRLGRLHFENLPWLGKIFKLFLRISFIISKGRRNAANIRVENVEIAFDDLPSSFDNMRILLITDLHIGGMDRMVERIKGVAGQLDYDFCILGGDYSFGRGAADSIAGLRMAQLARWLCDKSRVFGILGNHDKYWMGEALQKCGVEMLVNENICIEKKDGKIHLAGLDDCHYFSADDLELADSGILDGEFKIMISHSPEPFRQVAKAGYSLQLSGHTHAGQVCLPCGIVVVRAATVPRTLLKGKWRYKELVGYTSRGVGTSGIAVRYFCPPEITIFTLKRGTLTPCTILRKLKK